MGELRRRDRLGSICSERSAVDHHELCAASAEQPGASGFALSLSETLILRITALAGDWARRVWGLRRSRVQDSCSIVL